ncbi:MAG TPA: transposase [Ignavibacteria bacterium]|nr:transposase [Ignavibacteria bacterium]
MLDSSSIPKEALSVYKQRWTIENLFGNMKTKGFNIEVTQMKDDEKLKKSTALLTIAVLWYFLLDLWIESSVKIRIKNHGRKEKAHSEKDRIIFQ